MALQAAQGSVAAQRRPVVGAAPARVAFRSPHCGSQRARRAAPPARISLRESLAQAIGGVNSPKSRRLEVLDKLYHQPTVEKLQAVLAEDFTMGEKGYTKVFRKQDYIGLMAAVLSACPDFNWTPATNGEVADDGLCVVTVAACGNHTGAELQLPGLPPLPPSGKHFCLAEEVQMVRVDEATMKVTQIQVLPSKGAGPRALYAALGGRLPQPAPVAAADGAAAPPLP